MPRIEIDFVSEGFAAGSPLSNGPGVLRTNWDEILWSAMTVGRPNRQYVFQHGVASQYEALFRLSLVRMALEQAGPAAWRLRRTTAAKTLDPSEKGAVNYFLGLTMCKLFAAKLLDTPWLLHLDVFRPQLNAVLSGRSRPDLVGQNRFGQWLVIESKGRASQPTRDAKAKAKDQARRLTSINGVTPCLKVGGISYFRGDVLQFYWSDPSGPSARPIEIEADETVIWAHYYRPFLSLIHSNPRLHEVMLREPILMPVEGLDLQIGVLPEVLRLLDEQQWLKAHLVSETIEPGPLEGYHQDGLRVVAGETWVRKFEQEESFL